MKPVASQKRRPFSAYFGGGNRQKSAGARSGEGGGGFIVFKLFFAEKSITKSERFTGALS